jgi:hypothetical protein
LSTLITIATPGMAEYVISAGLTAVVAGAVRLVMDLARLGVLVNFFPFRRRWLYGRHHQCLSQHRLHAMLVP